MPIQGGGIAGRDGAEQLLLLVRWLSPFGSRGFPENMAARLLHAFKIPPTRKMPLLQICEIGVTLPDGCAAKLIYAGPVDRTLGLRLGIMCAPISGPRLVQ